MSYQEHKKGESDQSVTVTPQMVQAGVSALAAVCPMDLAFPIGGEESAVKAVIEAALRSPTSFATFQDVIVSPEMIEAGLGELDDYLGDIHDALGDPLSRVALVRIYLAMSHASTCRQDHREDAPCDLSSA